jgi:hypothetical protein
MSLRTLQGSSYPFIWIKGLLRYFNNLTPLKISTASTLLCDLLLVRGHFVNNSSFVRVGFEELQCQSLRVMEDSQRAIDCIHK